VNRDVVETAEPKPTLNQNRDGPYLAMTFDNGYNYISWHTK
jgi:hypothetical protein